MAKRILPLAFLESKGLVTKLLPVCYLSIACICHGEEKGPSNKQHHLAMQMQSAVLKNQDINKVREILNAGFDIDSPIGCGSFNALDGAVDTQNVDLLKMLLEKGSKPKDSAIISAAEIMNPEISLTMVKELLRAGANPNSKEDYPNPKFHSPLPLSTPLHAACYRGHIKVVELLLEKPGIEINLLNVDNRTPLMVAVEKGYDDIIRLLLSKGADSKIRNAKGETAADIARQQVRKREAILQQLESKAVAP